VATGERVKIPRDAVSEREWQALDEGAVLHVRGGTVRYRLTGSGRRECLQGLVTSDILQLAAGMQGFGALLTNKGMIVTPLWITRLPEHYLLEAPVAGAAALDEVLKKSLPPRLCRAESISADTVSIGLYGPAALAHVVGPAAVPAVARGAAGVDAVLDLADVARARAAADATPATDALLDTCRILAGIPSLGSEIDAKTLPQEVRLEELGAISYTKGCYLGQETVARLHFRGHANRRLVLLVLDGEPVTVPMDVAHAGGVVGRLTSACWSRDLDAWVGQAILRREVEDGAIVELASGMKAVVRAGRWLREP
jgi:folate-binding protein YgfZ